MCKRYIDRVINYASWPGFRELQGCRNLRAKAHRVLEKPEQVDHPKYRVLKNYFQANGQKSLKMCKAFLPTQDLKPCGQEGSFSGTWSHFTLPISTPPQAPAWDMETGGVHSLAWGWHSIGIEACVGDCPFGTCGPFGLRIIATYPSFPLAQTRATQILSSRTFIHLKVSSGPVTPLHPTSSSLASTQQVSVLSGLCAILVRGGSGLCSP